jgi:2-phosphosulfolactate phosphatase
MGFWDQSPYDIGCEWGARGVAALAPGSDVVIIVDVLSFSTCVDIAVARGATVYPYDWRDGASAAFAERVGGTLVGGEGARYQLSASSILTVAAGAQLVMPSPNGSTLTVLAQPTMTLAGCLRNARAVAAAATRLGRRVIVIPAGERWHEDVHGDRSLRPAVEDWVGAGAIISYLRGRRSPEAESAVAVYTAVARRLPDFLAACSSGRELVERGRATDVALAAQLNVSNIAPLLVNGAYVAAVGDAP